MCAALIPLNRCYYVYVLVLFNKEFVKQAISLLQPETMNKLQLKEINWRFFWVASKCDI